MAMAMATVLSQNVGGGDSACTNSSGEWMGGRGVGDHAINLLLDTTERDRYCGQWQWQWRAMGHSHS